MGDISNTVSADITSYLADTITGFRTDKFTGFMTDDARCDHQLRLEQMNLVHQSIT